MKIGILGSGIVGETLGSGFLKHGHEVMAGSRSPEKLAKWAAENPGAKTGSFQEAAAFGELIVLAVGGSVARDALALAGGADLEGKTIFDATNPVSGPPQKGVLPLFTTSTMSLMETLQSAYPKARFVKIFNSVGAASMVNPEFPDGKPTMFICGNDAGAKETAAKILDSFGWETADMGDAESARAIEPLCVLWCIPFFQKKEMTHAFRLLRR